MNAVINYPIINHPFSLYKDRVPLPTKATGFQNQRQMHISGIAMIVLGSLGVLLAAAAIAVGATGMALGLLPAGGLIGVGIGGAAVFITSIALGIFFLKKTYWEDQDFVDQQSEKAQNMSFSQIINDFGWQIIKKEHLISKNAFKNKFFAEVSNMGYLTTVRNYRSLIEEQGFIDWKDLQPKLQSESKNMTATQFKIYYGDQPFKDGVVDENDQWFTDMIKNGIVGLPYHRIAAEFTLERKKQVIKDDYIRELLKNQFSQCANDFNRFFISQGGSKTWQIFTDGILPASSFTSTLLDEIKRDQLTTKQLLQRYSWYIFSVGILSASEFRNAFLKELSPQHTLSDILNTYSWNILTYRMANASDLTPYALDEIKNKQYSFPQIIQAFGDAVFSSTVLGYSDIKDNIKQFLKNSSFCTAIEQYKSLTNYSLLPAHPDIPKLINRKKEADNELYIRLSEHEACYKADLAKVTLACENAKKKAKEPLDAAQKAIKDETELHVRAISDLESRIRTQISELESRRRTLKNNSSHVVPNSGELRILERSKENENARHERHLAVLKSNEQTASENYQRIVKEQNNIFDLELKKLNAEKERKNLEANQRYAQQKAAIDSAFQSIDLSNY